MPSRDAIIGLSIGQKSVQAVEVLHDGLTTTLEAMDEWENTLIGPQADPAGVEQFSASLTGFVRKHGIRARKMSVALDTSSLFLNTIPLETNLSPAEVHEQLTWELRQYYPDLQPKEFITDTHVLAHREADRCDDVLTVSVRRADTEKIQSVATRTGLDLYIVDVDHFSAETALRVNYPDTTSKFLALVGIKHHRLDISLIRQGNMECYYYYMVQSNAEIVDHIGDLSRETPGIFSIATYGPHLDKYLLVDIRRASSLLVEALNPLRHVNVANSLQLSESITAPSYRFAAAVGVALRKD